ncbi:Lanthionine synthetase C-like protein [Epilithonimonas bovis DSM 19482]|uniref:Lanthionine synthetase C-like protein n=1 Tax=Epilithonimonas bovis DSM 19482 TaxID=1121284 RepID=A0A1U7PT85_9FLAO|nr:Lanthionine synthetase C-like protein [Epilithonimonas bovis DSM 19482]
MINGYLIRISIFFLMGNIYKIIDYILDKTLKHDFDAAGYINGSSSKLIFLSNYYKNFESNEKVLKEIYSIRKNLLTAIENNSIPNLTLSYGLSGVLFSLEYSYDLIGDNSEIELDKDFCDFLILECTNMLYENNFDLLTGGIGILNFLIDNHIEFLDSNAIDKVLSALVEKQTNGIWLSKKDTKKINLGLSHGYISIVIVLLKIHNFFPEKKIEELLTNTLDMTLAFKNNKDANSCFPNFVNNDGLKTNKSSRLAWCYGDLGISLLFFLAGKNLSNDFYLEQGKEIIKKINERKDLKQNLIYDASFCHGASGVAHILNKLLYEYNIPELNPLYDYWIKMTIEMMETNKLLSYEPQDDNIEFVENYGLLNGYCGIGMVLIDYITRNKNLSWSNPLLV